METVAAQRLDKIGQDPSVVGHREDIEADINLVNEIIRHTTPYHSSASDSDVTTDHDDDDDDDEDDVNDAWQRRRRLTMLSTRERRKRKKKRKRSSTGGGEDGGGPSRGRSTSRFNAGSFLEAMPKKLSIRIRKSLSASNFLTAQSTKI